MDDPHWRTTLLLVITYMKRSMYAEAVELEIKLRRHGTRVQPGQNTPTAPLLGADTFDNESTNVEAD